MNMNKVKRKNHTSDFKAKVAIEAIRGIQTVKQIAAHDFCKWLCIVQGSTLACRAYRSPLIPLAAQK